MTMQEIKREAKWQKNIRKQREKSAKKKSLPSDLTAKQWRMCRRFFGYHCAYCLKLSSGLHKDHFIPFEKGGGYTAANIVPACQRCNSSKGAKDFDEWYPEQSFYSEIQAEIIKNYLAVKATKKEEREREFQEKFQEG